MMFVVHCSGLLVTAKHNNRASRRLFGPGEARKKKTKKRLLTNNERKSFKRNLLRTVPFVPPCMNRQHFNIARLLVYLSRSFLQNKENDFEKNILLFHYFPHTKSSLKFYIFLCYNYNFYKFL